MKFELDDEQYEFAAVLDAALAERCGARAVRAAWDQPGSGFDAARAALAEMGVLGLTAPASFGGSELAVSDCMLVFEALGRHLAPDDAGLTVGAVVPVLAAHADDSVVSELVPGLVDGSLTATIQDGWSAWAPSGADVDIVLVVTDDEVIVCRPAAGDVERTTGFRGGRALGRVGKDAPRVAVLGPDAAIATRRWASIVTTALLSGVADALIAMAVDYAKVRQQFGRVIGSFQAVKHQLADAATALETARRTVWWAAVCAESGSADVEEAVAVAKGTVGSAATAASYASLQVHGGIGYTWESDLHLWMKRAQALEAGWGSADDQWRRLATIYAAQDRAKAL